MLRSEHKHSKWIVQWNAVRSNDDSLVSTGQSKDGLACPGEMPCDCGPVHQHRREQANALQSSKWHGHPEEPTMEMTSSLVHQETEHHNEHPVSGQDQRAHQAVMEREQVKLWHDHLIKCPHAW